MSETKYCGHCRKSLPVTEFGKDRYTSDGLHSICRKSVSAKQCERRQIKRKPMILAPVRKHKIRDAVKRGDGTRESIQKLTRIPWDDLCDLLAEMTFDDNALTVDSQTGRFSVAA